MSKSGRKKNKKIRAKVVASRLEHQAQRERTKVAREVNKLQQLAAAGDINPHLQPVIQQVELLRQGHNSCIEAFNSNFASYGNAIQHMDTGLGAIMLVLDDLVAGGAENVTRRADSLEHGQGVYWEAYIALHLKKVAEKIEASKLQLTTPEPNGSDAGDVIFGGNTSHEAQPELSSAEDRGPSDRGEGERAGGDAQDPLPADASAGGDHAYDQRHESVARPGRAELRQPPNEVAT